MNTTPIIEAKNISKKYLINHQKAGYTTLRDSLMQLFKNPFRSIADQLTKKEVFWALKDLNFSIEQGEVVGIIGHNGAGKSTLLKILSQITLPTTGSITMRGRVGSLLEVGTGFHPELTGRENIFLNGAILGMSKKEITEKFDAIVAFADIAQFLDTPVKYYSSGMYVRLAFSVAAHMEPDILIIDEVLAVGDMEFQKKCLGKMDEITKKDGRTILFVSHNMNAIEQLCKKVIVLEKGNVVFQGNAKEGISHYFNSNNHGEIHHEILFTEENADRYPAIKNPYFSPTRFAVTDKTGNTITEPLTKFTEAFIAIEGITNADPSMCIGYLISDENNQTLYQSFQNDIDTGSNLLATGNAYLQSRLPLEILNEGIYEIKLICRIQENQWILKEDSNSPSIIISITGKLSDSSFWTVKRPGILAPIIPWSTIK